MPVTARKNQLYTMALPVLGKRCRWRQVHTTGDTDAKMQRTIKRIYRKHHIVGGCVQLIRSGEMAECYYAGNASLHPAKSVQPDTVFRTASIAKAVCALLVMRLQTQGKLSVEEDVSAFWHTKIRNPYHPDVPIPLGSLLSHSAGIKDSPRYFRSFQENITADEILSDNESYLDAQPYTQFRYSNFAAGLIGSLLESRFQLSFETLIQRELFQPLGIDATFDICKADISRLANSYRVLPARQQAAFSAAERLRSSHPVDVPDPQHHFLLASGNLYITAADMAKLCLLVMHGGIHDGKQFINNTSLTNLLVPQGSDTSRWPGMRHAMGLFALDDTAVSQRVLHGHQGFAYGAVNGFFFDDNGNGFVSFNSGASEARIGRLSLLNRDLIRVLLP